ncbi:MAG: amylo-alpha-1,6-glucosidase [Armatimonadota bacterium]
MRDSSIMPDETFYPNIWGRGGALFGFSGMDGVTDIDSQLICALHEDDQGRGLRLYTKTPAFLGIEFREVDQVSYADEVVAGDVLTFNAVAEESTVKCELVAVDNTTVGIRISVIDVESPKTVLLSLKMQDSEYCLDPTALTIISGDECVSLAVIEGNASVSECGIRFDIQKGDVLTCLLDYQTGDSDTLSFGFVPDIDQIIASRLEFFKQLPVSATTDPLTLRTFAKCASVQKTNCCTAQGDIAFNWTTPDRWPHKYMWIWDSAFHALGLRHFAPEWAMDSLKAVVSKVREDGFLPHMMTPDDSKDSTIIQPPILAWASWKVYEKTKDVSFLSSIYDGIRDMLLYDMNVMDKDHDRLAEWGDSCASGMDNSPRFDQTIGAAVDLNSFIANDLLYLMKIADILGKSDDSKRCIDERYRLAALINEKLWDAETGFYYDLDPDGNKVLLKAVSGFTPMFAGICSSGQAETLQSHLISSDEFWRQFPVPSVSADEPSFSNDMWRGPVWINYNYMIIEALKQYGYKDTASELKQKTINEIARWYGEDGIIYEYYDSEGINSPSMLNRKGHKPSPDDTWPLGRCIRDYHWTAALFIDLLMD